MDLRGEQGVYLLLGESFGLLRLVLEVAEQEHDHTHPGRDDDGEDVGEFPDEVLEAVLDGLEGPLGDSSGLEHEVDHVDVVQEVAMSMEHCLVLVEEL